jgi:hypothetical protein
LMLYFRTFLGTTTHFFGAGGPVPAFLDTAKLSRIMRMATLVTRPTTSTSSVLYWL